MSSLTRKDEFDPYTPEGHANLTRAMTEVYGRLGVPMPEIRH